MLPALLMYKLRTERINNITSVKRHDGTTVNHQTAPCKGIQDSLAFWIPCDGFRIPSYWIFPSYTHDCLHIQIYLVIVRSDVLY